MIYTTLVFMCNGCKAMDEYEDTRTARKAGWGIADDKNTCLCPSCMRRERIKEYFKVKFK